jgi:hypothetical protein
MDRRGAFKRILLSVGGVILTISGYDLYRLAKAPDIQFLEKQNDLLDSVADVIIPKTGSVPGGKDAGVGSFIITMIKECTHVVSQNRFIDGLKELRKYCQSQFGKAFESCSDQQKKKVLDYFEQQSIAISGNIGKVESKFLGLPFFTILKIYTAIGYCTSEDGATKGLAYDYIPGKYIGCMPLGPKQKAWATK